MHIATKAIAYHIACYKSTRLVRGEALALPPPFEDMRFCVRKDGREWVVDHYDSGMAMIGPVVDALETRNGRLGYMHRWQRDGRSKTRVVAWLIRYLLHLTRKQSSLLAQIREYVHS